MILNTPTTYGLLSKSFHWISALAVFFLFGVGYWMMDLDYYSQWYQTAPHWHESVGILLLILTVLRLAFKTLQPKVQPLASHSKVITLQAKLAHYVLYALMLIMFATGYLVPTADDRAIEVFTWFSVPSLGELFAEQEDIAGLIHEYCAYTLIALALLHGLAAVKHHIIDKDDTLNRMLLGSKSSKLD